MQIVIPSKGREGAIADRTLRWFPDAIVCVEDREAENYAAVCKRLLLHPKLDGLPAILNWILACRELTDDCLCIIDDDLLSIRSAISGERIEYPEDVHAMVENCRIMAEGCGAALWGFPVNVPTYWTRAYHPLSFTGRIGSFRGISNRDIRIDERFMRHDDTDITLTELLLRRIVFRDGRFRLKFAPVYRTKGGSRQVYQKRSKREEERDLARKWGKYVCFRHMPGHWNETSIRVTR